VSQAEGRAGGAFTAAPVAAALFAVGPIAALPMNSQFFRPRATCFINCSTSLLSIGNLPSLR
jgi:hypothetical protein